MANTIAANGVIELFDLVRVHFTAHEWLAGTTAAARNEHFFETRLARSVVTLIFAVVSSALEKLSADLFACCDGI